MRHLEPRLTIALVLLVGLPALSQGQGDAPNPADYYTVSTVGSSEKLKPGEAGRVVIEISAIKGAYLEGKAPWKVELKSKGVKLEKDKLALADAKMPKKPDLKYPVVRFEAPIVASEAGHATVEANVRLFVCLPSTVCMPHKNVVSFAVEVQ